MNDKKNGMGEFIYPDGRVYRGNFFDDQKDGQGVLELTDGTLVKQHWVMGQLIEDADESVQTRDVQNSPLYPSLHSSNKPPTSQNQYSIMRTTRVAKLPLATKDASRTTVSDRTNMMLQTQQSQFATTFQESPQPGESAVRFTRPPVGKKTSHSYRTTRIQSEYQGQGSEDFFLHSVSSMN